MILTVTLNPLLEKRMFYSSIELGKTFRTTKEYYSAGGKGINVSRQLNKLGLQNSALTFLGGNNGKLLRHCLVNESIDFSAVSTKSETRSGELIIEETAKRVTSFLGSNSVLLANEVDEFKKKLDKMIQNCSVVVFSGSSQGELTDDIFKFGIELAHEHDKISILDTYGAALSKSIEAAPTVVHNNIDEVKNSFGLTLDSEKEIISYLNSIYQNGVRLSFLSNGAECTYASKFDFIYKVIPPSVSKFDETGSGDAFVAGIAYGLENAMVFDEFVKLATALGSANASMHETCSVTIDQMNDLEDQVQIIEIGKKMKLIDDSPNY